MRLIIEYNVGDGYTWSGTITIPVVYESAERFIVDFEAFCKENHKYNPNKPITKFAGHEFDVSDFFYGEEIDTFSAPQIYTVDEYFKQIELCHTV